MRATLIHSLRTADTPKAVLISIGQTEQMKITKIAEAGILDRVERERHPGERRDRLQHLDERIERTADSGDMPIRKPSGIATITASR